MRVLKALPSCLRERARTGSYLLGHALGRRQDRTGESKSAGDDSDALPNGERRMRGIRSEPRGMCSASMPQRRDGPSSSPICRASTKASLLPEASIRSCVVWGPTPDAIELCPIGGSLETAQNFGQSQNRNAAFMQRRLVAMRLCCGARPYCRRHQLCAVDTCQGERSRLGGC